MCIRDRSVSSESAAESTAVSSELIGKGAVTYDPVSYTHLDVYKRQFYNSTMDKIVKRLYYVRRKRTMTKLDFTIPFSGFASTTFINCFTSVYMYLEGMKQELSLIHIF